MDKQLSILDQLATAQPKVELPELWTADDIFAALAAENFLHFSEDKRVERKSGRKNPKDLADDYSAFANTQPHGGIILVGIEDHGEITGFANLGPNRVSEFEGQNAHCPDARTESRRIAAMNSRGQSDFILAIRVYHRADRLVETTAGNAFLRTGKAKRKLTEAEKREIRISIGEVDYEKEPVSLKYPDEFSKKLVDIFYSSFVEKRAIRISPTIEEVLCWNHLGKMVNGKFIPNLACAILFANDPRAVCPGARIRFQRFSGYSEGSGATYNLVHDTAVTFRKVC